MTNLTTYFKSIALTLAVLLSPLVQAVATELPEGAFRGKSNQIRKFSNDVMALIIQKDPQATDTYYAVLAHYDRLPLSRLPVSKKGDRDVSWGEKVAIAKWVPRMHIYRVEMLTDRVFMLKPLTVSASGDIVVKQDAPASMLTLNTAGSLKDARLPRLNNDGQVVETIEFGGLLGEKIVSTWEDYVAGDFYGTKRSSGLDYFKDNVNSVLDVNGIATFNWIKTKGKKTSGTEQVVIKGRYQMVEKLPKMFTFVATDPENKSDEKMANKIGVFIDIMNWKDWDKLTNELLIINPDDPNDVGFFYERGKR